MQAAAECIAAAIANAGAIQQHDDGSSGEAAGAVSQSSSASASHADPSKPNAATTHCQPTLHLSSSSILDEALTTMSSLSATATATGAIVTADNGNLITITPAGGSAWAIGSATISAGQLYTLPDSQVFSVDSTGLHLDGTPITTSALGPVPASATTGIAVLTDGNNTVTAYQVPGNTALGVVNGFTLSYRGPGITASGGEVVSMAWDGIAGSTTTALFSSLPGGVVPGSGLGSASSTSLSTNDASASSASSSPGSSQSSTSSSTSGVSSSSVLSSTFPLESSPSATSMIMTTSTNAAGSAITSTIVVTAPATGASSTESTSLSGATTTPSIEGSTVTSTALVGGSPKTASGAGSSQTSEASSASANVSSSTGLQSGGTRLKLARTVAILVALLCARVMIRY